MTSVSTKTTSLPVLACVIAGGRGTRLKEESNNQPLKPFVTIDNTALILRVIQRLTLSSPKNIAINTSHASAADTLQFEALGLPIIQDANSIGPLGGLLAALQWANNKVTVEPQCSGSKEDDGERENSSMFPSCQGGWLLTAPCDTPFLPSDYLKHLLDSLKEAPKPHQIKMAISSYANKIHPLCGLFHTNLLPALTSFLQSPTSPIPTASLTSSNSSASHITPKNPRFSLKQWLAQQSYSVANFDHHTEDPFFNINTPADLEAAQIRFNAQRQ
ncbi:molybdenum cofactor guanylyltransferase [Marinibactrum halimedae]|uniref:Molybdenum cofactor guanylyltransferase n=1 Tax=Marinibactrum halimedae TaxID=1444977 RepID=A0AA37WLN6_9GAMM|nr:molybdenum cofactor guanylyltransferase [Marinibactrum halimedae]MCD9457945.1 molybdenum cofactor guanylyltransferase [Marinibactrum halimedae]GLS26224.1 hypothetical protein GCM10007877_19390 [Marinibactrum halimedae]